MSVTSEQPGLPADTADVAGVSPIAALAERLASVEANGFDAAVTDALRTVAHHLDADAAVLWCDGPDRPGTAASHHWCASGPVPPFTGFSTMAGIAVRLLTEAVSSFTSLEEIADADTRARIATLDVGAVCLTPLPSPDGAAGPRRGLAVFTVGRRRHWPPRTLHGLRLVSALLAQALARQEALRAIVRLSAELHQLRHVAHASALRPSSLQTLPISRPIVCESVSVRRALEKVEQVAATPSTVLLLGETGVGKELFAQAIHELSSRQKREMVRVSCAAIPGTLIESELFGHERGAFTGALGRQVGRFELANQSTLFLDEIGELSPEVQVKLLRVLEERVIERLGSTDRVRIDVRIVAATHRDLDEMVLESRFREDLFYRLNVFPIVVPPLRDRVEDIPALVWQFVDESSRKVGKTFDAIARDSMEQLRGYAWPGNVRELRNVVERAVIVGSGPELTIPLPARRVAVAPGQLTLDQLQIEHIRATLASTGGRVRGPGGAAERLGLKPTTLETRMAKFGLTRATAVRAQALHS